MTTGKKEMTTGVHTTGKKEMTTGVHTTGKKEMTTGVHTTGKKEMTTGKKETTTGKKGGNDCSEVSSFYIVYFICKNNCFFFCSLLSQKDLMLDIFAKLINQAFMNVIRIIQRKMALSIVQRELTVDVLLEKNVLANLELFVFE